MLSELQNAEERQFEDGEPYYKFYSRWSCLVLTPAHRRQLIDQINLHMEEAKKQGEEFFGKLEEALAGIPNFTQIKPAPMPENLN